MCAKVGLLEYTAVQGIFRRTMGVKFSAQVCVIHSSIIMQEAL